MFITAIGCCTLGGAISCIQRNLEVTEYGIRQSAHAYHIKLTWKSALILFMYVHIHFAVFAFCLILFPRAGMTRVRRARPECAS